MDDPLVITGSISSVPPKVMGLIVDFSCDLNQKDDVELQISWVYGMRQVGVEYPGETRVRLELSPGGTVCSDVTASDTSCTVLIPRGVYDITLTQTNDIGSTVEHLDTVDVRALVVDQAFLRLNTELVLVVNVRANARCPETAGSLMMVTFGATSVAGRDCDGQWNSSEKIISSGESVSFYADTDTISLTSDETFCFIVSIDRVPAKDDFLSTPTRDTECGDTNVFVDGAAGGFTVAASVLVVLLVGLLLGCSGMWFLMRQGSCCKRGISVDRHEKELAAIYDEPAAVGGAICMSENQAYGQVSPCNRN
ncbi:hypothetical protein GBAR_LOCUS15360 [Geodia barretti]|uniref:Uncharacterized protein n=1 Tax=Geodia barretti TaxID=519541 RepID=A0AA35SCS8_GEOBA|nr:hypothetical protein GBAR_LOCUS15360 [Geodia barretti]